MTVASSSLPPSAPRLMACSEVPLRIIGPDIMAAPAELPEFSDSVVAIQTARFWDAPLAQIDAKYDQVRQMAYLLRTKNKNHANKDGTMSPQQQREYLQKFEAELITPEEAAMRKRGASNAAYHYLGCAKTFALMGKAYADALMEMNRD